MPLRAASKRDAIDILMVALRNSSLKDVGLDALASILHNDPEMSVRGEIWRLQAAWDLLEHQDGFDAEGARAPFCYMKSIESTLGFSVELPKALVDLTPAERTRYAGICLVKRDEVERLLERPETSGAIASGLRVASQADQKNARPSFVLPGVKKGVRISPAVRRALTIALPSVAGLAVVLSVVLASDCGSLPKKTMNPAELAGIPVDKATLLGTEVDATLADPSWLTVQSEDVRRHALGDALKGLKGKADTIVLFLGDSRKATAQWKGKDKDPYIRFY